MKIFCVTGASGSDLEMVASLLTHAGIQPALAPQDQAITMQSWHEHVLAASSDEDDPNKQVEEIGKFWEQLASSLFVANLRAPNWSWTDSRSVWLLDYWRKFDPNIRFVLVYTPPKRALAAALAAHQVSGDALTHLLETWATYNREILRFHKRFPKKTILVNAEDCAANPAALIEECSARWKLKLSADGLEPKPSFSPKPLATYLAEQSLVIQPELKLLQDELEGAVHPIAPHDNDAPPFDIFDALQDYSALRDMAVQARTLNEHQQQLAATIRDLEAQVAERAASSTAVQDELSANKKRLDDAIKENEQILLQMHQLQEELERTFLESKKLTEDNAAKAAALTELQKKAATLETQAQGLKSEVAAAKTAQNPDQKRQLDEQTAKNATLSQELQAARQQCKQLEERSSADAERLKAQLKEAAQDAAKQEAASAAAIANLKKESEAANRAAKEAQQEAELILIQLHQVQEELENYFVQHKAAAQRNKELESRWQRMLERNPEYCDYAALDVSAPQDNNCGRLNWRFTELNAAGRSFPELHFSTVIEDGATRIVLPGESAGTNSRAMPLTSLTTTEWSLMETLCKILISLTDPANLGTATLGGLGEAQIAALRDGVQRLVNEMAELPPSFRFDKIVLKREQVNPDYEHLWLRVMNSSLGAMRWPEFEFRLSCANVRPGKFGMYPKLEFPAGVGQVPFENWFIESYDDFGEKLELRFALPESMDTAVWEQLSEHDHAFMGALIAAIPSMLAHMVGEGVALAREWSEWNVLASNIQRIHGVRTAVVALPVVVQAKPVVSLVAPTKAKAPRAQAVARRAKVR